MIDDQMRAVFDGVPVPEFDDVPFTAPVPLDKATVAIVTTAGLHMADQPSFVGGDQSFRVLDAAARDLRFSHVSQNFDRSGIAADLNVVYPIDRLDELAVDGRVGAVAPHHLAFMGAQDETMSTIRMDTGPAAAKLLLDDGVDVVLLTPI